MNDVATTPARQRAQLRIVAYDTTDDDDAAQDAIILDVPWTSHLRHAAPTWASHGHNTTTIAEPPVHSVQWRRNGSDAPSATVTLVDGTALPPAATARLLELALETSAAHDVLALLDAAAPPAKAYAARVQHVCEDLARARLASTGHLDRQHHHSVHQPCACAVHVVDACALLRGMGAWGAVAPLERALVAHLKNAQSRNAGSANTARACCGNDVDATHTIDAKMCRALARATAREQLPDVWQWCHELLRAQNAESVWNAPSGEPDNELRAALASIRAHAAPPPPARRLRDAARFVDAASFFIDQGGERVGGAEGALAATARDVQCASDDARCAVDACPVGAAAASACAQATARKDDPRCAPCNECKTAFVKVLLEAVAHALRDGAGGGAKTRAVRTVSLPVWVWYDDDDGAFARKHRSNNENVAHLARAYRRAMVAAPKASGAHRITVSVTSPRGAKRNNGANDDDDDDEPFSCDTEVRIDRVRVPSVSLSEWLRVLLYSARHVVFDARALRAAAATTTKGVYDFYARDASHVAYVRGTRLVLLDAADAHAKLRGDATTRALIDDAPPIVFFDQFVHVVRTHHLRVVQGVEVPEVCLAWP